MNGYAIKARKCRKSCLKCSRLCVKQLNHLENCDCDTNHFCQINCEITKKCKVDGNTCIEKYGHEGEHRSEIGNHKCQNKCSINSFGFLCSNQIGHVRELEHNCGNKHPCNKNCSNKKCTRTC